MIISNNIAPQERAIKCHTIYPSKPKLRKNEIQIKTNSNWQTWDGDVAQNATRYAYRTTLIFI